MRALILFLCGTALCKLSQEVLVAANLGDLDAVEAWLRNGHSVDERGSVVEAEGMTLLHAAAMGGQTALVSDLLKRGASINIVTANRKETALMAAVDAAQKEVMLQLLEAGADVNLQSMSGATALMSAAYDGRIDIVQELLFAGADASLRDYNDQTALDIAQEHGHPRIVKMIEHLTKAAADEADTKSELKKSDTPPVDDGDLPMYRGYLVIRAGGLNDIDEESGHTKLHQAVLIKYTARVRFLLKLGADVDVLTKRGGERAQKFRGAAEGNTALSLAADGGVDEICRLLIEAGARLDHRGYADNTALWLAAAAGHTKIVERLLRAGASVDKRGAGMGDGDTSDTPLLRAAYEGHTEVVRLLLKSGASVNARSEPEGGTSLHEAIKGGGVCHDGGGSTQRLRVGHRNNYDEIISILVANGAAVDVRSHAGDSPLLAAISAGCLHLVKQLIQAEANVDIASHPASGSDHPGIGIEGQTPLIAAAALGEPEIAEELLRAGASTSPKDSTGSTALSWARGPCNEKNEELDCVAQQSRKRQIVKMLRMHVSSHGAIKRGETPTPRLTSDDAGGGSWNIVALLTCAAAAAASWLLLSRAGRWQQVRAWAQLWLRALRVHPPQAEAADEGRGRARRRARGRARGADVRGLNGGAVRAEGSAQGPPPSDQPQWWTDLAEFHDDLELAARQERPEFMCSLTHEIMRCPANLVDGEESHHTYEHDAIVAWFATGSTTDPISRAEIDPARRTIVRDNRLQREIRSWCQAKVEAFRQELTSVAQREEVAAPSRIVHVFVDHSNVAIGAARAGHGPDLDVAWLVRHVEAGRDVKERVVIGSYESERTRDAWEAMGYSVATDSRRGPERFVDDALHAQLMRTAARRFERSRIIALVTGDGNCNEGRTTFPECIEEALKNDWHVELYSWRSSTSQVFMAQAKEYASHLTVHYLDDATASSDEHGSGAAGSSAASYAAPGRGRGGRGGRHRGTGRILVTSKDDSPPPPPPTNLPLGSAAASSLVDDDGLQVRPFGLDVLRGLPAAELAAIEGFEVAQPGKGTLRWPGKTDVRGVLEQLSTIVQFRQQGVSVYAHGGKPRAGEGLNKLCRYTMENVWARDRTTGDFISDAKSIGAFRAQLLRKADQMGAKMLAYDDQKGEWTIAVQHF